MMRIVTIVLVLAALACTGCVNRYTRIDDGGAGFWGIDRHLVESKDKLHVLQIHGMGDHRHEDYCADGSKDKDKSNNIRLQNDIAKELGFVLASQSKAKEIRIGATPMGQYSVRRFTNPHDANAELLFSCVTWGDASRTIKLEMLQLDENFYEKSDNERHRAYLNKQAKRFVNRSFSDPVIYAGTFGPMIRRALWEGIQLAAADHKRQQMLLHPELAVAADRDMSVASLAADFFQAFDTVVISDSLGSRVMFDTFCEFGAPCSKPKEDEPSLATNGAWKPAAIPVVEPTAAEAEPRALVAQASASVEGMYMFANQLPLIELAYVPTPDDDVPLEKLLTSKTCFQPAGAMLPVLGGSREHPATIVAFTDANDALSYDLGEKFLKRCAPKGSGVRIVNLVLPNAWQRWFGVYTSLGKAHASGFKDNKNAIFYLVYGKTEASE